MNKINMRQAKLLVEGSTFFKEVVDTKTQDLLEHIAARAEEKGMSINAAKTGLMLVSAATSFTPRIKLKLGGETVTGQDSMKILGVTIDKDASFKTHVANIAAKMRARTWALTRLRKKGLSEEKLVRAYKGLIRPTIEYASPAWHSSITAGQAADLERQQTLALRNIFGPSMSANKMRKRAGIDTLTKRRESAVKKFAIKCTTNPRCQSWFTERPPRQYPRRSSVHYPVYREELARTDRHRNNPKNYIVRKANEA